MVKTRVHVYLRGFMASNSSNNNYNDDDDDDDIDYNEYPFKH